MRQPGVAGWIIRSEIIESMPFHDVTSAAVLYDEFSAIAVATQQVNDLTFLGLSPATGCCYAVPGRHQPVLAYDPTVAVLPDAVGKREPSAPSR